MARIIIVIPTYNEAENLPALLEGIRHECPEAFVMIVDDASPDGTADIAQSYTDRGEPVRVLRRTGIRGYGRACLDGFNAALRDGFELVLTMDADLSHDPKYLPAIVREVEQGADLVIGSRYCNGVSVVNWPLRRIILSSFANWYVRVILRLPIVDCTSGYRGYSAEALDGADLTAVKSDGYAFLVDIATRIHRAGFVLRETPIIFVDRRAGESKMSKKVMFESAIIPWKLRFTRFPRRAGTRKTSAAPRDAG